MTATETHEDVAEEVLEAADPSGDELFQLLASNDHKAVGRRWIALSLLFAVDLAVFSVLTNFERVSLADFDLFGSAVMYQQAWTLVRTSGVFLVALPLLIGIATFIVPLQVGSPSIAFPRLAAAAFWAWLVAAGAHIASFIGDGGLGPAVGTRSESTQLTITSLGAMAVAIVAASVCILTTIIALRPAGMTLLRVPVFTWSMLVACSVWLFSLPVLVANLIYAWTDLQGRDPIFFGDPDRLWGDVEWAFQQPQIYSLAIPVLGIAAEITPVAAKVRQANRNMILVLIALLGALSFGAWAQSSFSRGADPAFVQGDFIYEELLFILFGLAALIPVLGLLGGVADTVRRGTLPKMGAAITGAVVGLLLLLAAVVVGAIRVLPFTHTLFEENDDGVHEMLSSAGAQYALMIAAVAAASIAALVWWAPKILGGYAAEGPAALAILAVFGGGLALGIGDFASSFIGQRDLSISADVEDGVEALNWLGLAGAALLVVGALAVVGALLPAVRSRETLPDDPWDGHTLEWAAPSPPPTGNFVEPLPPIRSEAPLLDEFEEVES